MSSIAMYRGFRVPDEYLPRLPRSHLRHLRHQRAVGKATEAATTSTAVTGESESAITRTATAFAESVSDTWGSVVFFFSGDDASDHGHDCDTKKKTIDNEDSDDADADVNTDVNDSDECKATDTSSSDSNAETEATVQEDEDVVRTSTSTTTTMATATSSSSHCAQIKCDVFDTAKRVYVLVKLAMAAISRQCVAAMQWVLRVCGVRSGARATTSSSSAPSARSSSADGSSSSSSNSSSSTSVSESVCASSICTTLTLTPTPITTERARPEAIESSQSSPVASTTTSTGAPMAMDAIKKTMILVEPVVAIHQNSEPASTIAVVAMAFENEDDEANEKHEEEEEEKEEEEEEEEELLLLPSARDVDSQVLHHDLVVVAPTSSPPGPSVTMASCAMTTRTLIEAAVAEQLKCEDQLVNVLRCVLLASNWHVQAEDSSAPIRVRVSRVAFTASLPVHEAVIGTTALLSVREATAALVQQREMVHSTMMAGTATMACVTTCIDALQFVGGGCNDDGDGDIYDDALWLWEREEQLTQTAALAFHWIDRLVDALAAVEDDDQGQDQDQDQDHATDTDEDCERQDTMASFDQNTKAVSAWCEPPQDEAPLDAAWARWVEAWANEMAPRMYATRAMPRENLTVGERASVEARISTFCESVRRACMIKAAAVAPVPASALVAVVPAVAQVQDQVQAQVQAATTSTSSATATEATETTETTETIETVEAKTQEVPASMACGTLPAPDMSSASQAATPSSTKATMCRGASGTPAIKTKPKADPKSKSTLKVTAKTRWR